MDNQQTTRKGILAAKSGNSILARLHLQEAVEANPDNVDCWLWLAWTAESPESGRLYLQQVLERDPEHEAARLGLQWTESLIDYPVPACEEDSEEAAPAKNNDRTPVYNDRPPEPALEEPREIELQPTDEGEPGVDENDPVAEAELDASEPVLFEEVDEDPVQPVDVDQPAETPAELTFASEALDTEEPSDGGLSHQEQPPLHSEFNEQYCMQEAVVASVDEQLASLFASEQLLDELQSFDNSDKATDEGEEETLPECESAHEPRVEESEQHADNANVACDAVVEQVTTDDADAADHQQDDLAATLSEGSPESKEDNAAVVAETDEPQDAESAPSDASEEQPQAETPDSTHESDDRPLIVICDDSPTVRKLVCMSLEPHGYRVMTASDGAEGSELIGRVVPNLILTDINMPEVDGYQLCKNVTKNPLTQNIPVIMLSGKDGLFDKLRGKLVGSTDHMSKPFSPRDLLRVVRHHLEACSAWSN
jgi:twitching motility two-component system response regulator PilG